MTLIQFFSVTSVYSVVSHVITTEVTEVTEKETITPRPAAGSASATKGTRRLRPAETLR